MTSIHPYTPNPGNPGEGNSRVVLAARQRKRWRPKRSQERTIVTSEAHSPCLFERVTRLTYSKRAMRKACSLDIGDRFQRANLSFTGVISTRPSTRNRMADCAMGRVVEHKYLPSFGHFGMLLLHDRHNDSVIHCEGLLIDHRLPLRERKCVNAVFENDVHQPFLCRSHAGWACGCLQRYQAPTEGLHHSSAVHPCVTHASIVISVRGGIAAVVEEWWDS